MIPLLAAALALAAGTATAGAIPEPEGFRGEPYRAPVPASLEGATVIGAEEAVRLWQSGEAAFVDVLPRPPRPELPEGTLWHDPPHPTIPGATWLPNTGYERLSAEEEAYLAAGLSAASGGRRDRPLVIFCFSDCWMSWNAAKRAVALGYTRVHWFPDGIDAWQLEALPTENVDPFRP